MPGSSRVSLTRPWLSPAPALVGSPYLLGFCLGQGSFPMTFVRHSWLTFGNSEGSPRGRQSNPGSCYYCGQGRQLWGLGTLPLFTRSGSTGQLPTCPSPDPARPITASLCPGQHLRLLLAFVVGGGFWAALTLGSAHVVNPGHRPRDEALEFSQRLGGPCACATAGLEAGVQTW